VILSVGDLVVPHSASVILPFTLLIMASVIIATLGVQRLGRAKRRWYAAQAHGAWLSAREELFSLLMRGDITPKSGAFQALFHLQEFVLTHPGDYDAIAAAVRRVVTHPKDGRSPVWLDEHTEWSPTVRDHMASILGHMARGANFIAASHPNPVARLMYTSLKFLGLLRLQKDVTANYSIRSPAHAASFTAIRAECDLIDGSHEFDVFARRVSAPSTTLSVVE
jgi:hypothetical protein